ncbi:MAG: ribonuclease Y [Planctomycetota bacterium]|jgi:ribonuclease Y
MNPLIIALIALVCGGLIGYFVRIFIALNKKKSLELQIKQTTLNAQEKAQKITTEASEKAETLILESKKKEEEREKEFVRSREHLLKKEELLDQRQIDINSEGEVIKVKIEAIRRLKKEMDETLAKREGELERVAKLTTEDAKKELLAHIESEYQEDLIVRMNKLEQSAKDKLEKRAQDILVTTIQRLASSTASEITTTNVTIPNEEIKGKVIGREGRNIRAFERASGVELIVDDTPGAIVISSFDPVRRQVARVALENLILDGRIQPAKIEEFVEKAQKEINGVIKEKGEWAVNEVGVYNLDPRIISILGRLYFRTSYGQNVLLHSVEMTHLAGMLAEELGADVAIAKAGALVHDIGKALDHEVQGTHIEIGIRILEKFGADPRIIVAMKSHHDDYPHETIEAVIVQSADMISGARPGARRDTLENYVKRLKDLEGVATSFKGVEKAYALSAGREIRVFVHPAKTDDLTAKQMAKDIARKIEADLKYPGEIKITLIRENRVIEYAR